jgi:aminocarboxymuconate-semialdehyde decarboxylase
MSKTYDVHAHLVPTSLLDRLAKDGGQCGVTLAEDGGRTKIILGQETAGSPRPDLVDEKARLETMDRTGVDVQLISAWIALTGYTLPTEQGAAWSRLFNESMAETVAGHPDRYLGLCTVPLQSGEAAAAELRYAVQQLGMVGAQIATTVAGLELDDPGLEPFWAAAEELRSIVVIHPDQVLPGRDKPRYVLGNFVGNAAETTIAAAHLVYGGVLERHPDLRVCLVHGGGYAPYQAGRMDHGYQAEPRLVDKRLSRLPSDYLRMLYFDTVTHSPDVMRFLVDFAGAGHVVLGSDYPFEMGEADPVGSIQRVPGLPEAEQQQILSGNLERLVADVRREQVSS